MGNEQVFGPGAVDGVPEPPAAERAAALGVRRIEAIEALAARRDRADDDPLSDLVFVVQALAELVEDADRIVAENGPADRVLALDDVHVGPADGRGDEPDDCFAGPGPRFRHFFDPQIVDTLNTTAFIVSMVVLRLVVDLGARPARTSVRDHRVE